MRFPAIRLLAKAKAGRAERIQAERALEKKYVAKNELKFDSDTSRVQVAVYKLSKAGSLIESGYLALAAEELGRGSWEEDLQVAGDNLGYQPQSFIKNVAELRRACMAGEVDKAKSAYVASARSLEEYALASNVAGYLKLLLPKSEVIQLTPCFETVGHQLLTFHHPCHSVHDKSNGYRSK